MCYIFFLKIFAALLRLISPDDLPMTVGTSWEERKSGAHSRTENKHVFWGDGRERTHRLEVVYNKCPQVALGVFTYLCTAIWSIFLPSALETSLGATWFPGWLSNRVAAPYLRLMTSYRGSAPMEELKVMLKACHGQGEALLSISLTRPPLWATSSRLWETPETKKWTLPKNVYFWQQGFSPLWAPCKNILSEVSQKTRRLSKEARSCVQGDLLK